MFLAFSARLLCCPSRWRARPPLNLVCCAQLKHLHKLDLSGNNITAVPSGIGALSELEELRWGHNNLVTLPGEIGQLR
eukprot:SAG25_NODE_1809_length_2302_cov_1.543804_3_plen_78_part_00